MTMLMVKTMMMMMIMIIMIIIMTRMVMMKLLMMMTMILIMMRAKLKLNKIELGGPTKGTPQLQPFNANAWVWGVQKKGPPNSDRII